MSVRIHKMVTEWLCDYGLNIIGTPNQLKEAYAFLKNEFEMKDFGETKSCIGLQIEHLSQGVLTHQFAYVEKLLN